MEEHKAFSLSEVSLHSSKKDCWLIIHSQVYDVTKFLEEHPGGEEVLIEASGKGDATKGFEEVGHSSTATSMMSGYLIGVLDQGSTSGSAAGAEQSSKVVAREEKETTLIERKPSSAAFMNLFPYLIPLLIVALAFGGWYFLNKAKP
ncbi:hypothetical protein HHK36_013390 [Tetracentron sinense]|uniref:Cytochrome b5 heme-binding domain-containing protein n=1 Tax=Tetracentron sinense TaxID=13715 RepID=A0A834Z7K0_TETSI|nr:hypothetical protein HHK36_013390 [Tetracentron sinense]